MCISFMDLLEELDVGDPLLVISDDVLIFDTVRVLWFSK
jgi:hypothetical protein